MAQMLLSKFYLFFLSPFNWILVLVILAYLFRKTNKKKGLLISAIVILFVFGNQVVYNKVMMWWQPEPVNLQGKKFKAAVLLGGIGWVEDKPRNLHYFRTASDRFIQILKLYKQGIVEKIIISAGGGGEGWIPNEATFLEDEFLKQGVPKTALIVEKKSATTYENALYTKELLKIEGIIDPVVLVTSAIHINRAEKVFAKAGIQVIAYPCDYDIVNVKLYFTDYILPDVEVLFKWKFIFKEWIGIAAYRAKGRL